MGSEAKLWRNSEVPKLPLLAVAAMESPDRSGMLTPPIHTSVSVPFRWEEEPGKPRFCFRTPNSSSATQTKCLELPPRLLLLDPKISKLPPPIPAHKGIFQLPKQSCGSFRYDKSQLGAMVLRKRGVLIEKEWFCWLGKLSFGRKGEVGSACGSVFPSSLEKENEDGVVAERSSSGMKVAETQKEGSFSSCLVKAKTEFWGSIGEGLKQINVPWKSKKA
ncbi:uncharacterized protein At4g00950 [Cucurbita maxima]|uniref:Uncharacterized protein At4g00950 n=1 Tax=Cucurbita maxima TaxID=3661 RepID=A0A6J1ISE2_CUCMA|nr:uncharacterized protein At4g00950 [Cucurbita maxima]